MFVIPIICILSGCGLDQVEWGAREPWDRGQPVPEWRTVKPVYPDGWLEGWGDEDENDWSARRRGM